MQFCTVLNIIWTHYIWLLQLRDYPYYVPFMKVRLKKIHVVGVDTRVNLTSPPENVLQALHSLN